MISAITAQLRDDDGGKLGVVVANPKNFSTGSRGYYGQTRLAIEGKRYLVTLQAVEIGSKNNAGQAETVELRG